MCNEETARAALRAMGIRSLSQALVRSWIQANRADRGFRESAKSQGPNVAPPTTHYAARASSGQTGPPDWHRRGSSKSRLEPTLREPGTLRRRRGPRKGGRPRIVASWFPEVAQSMADGTPLRDALRLNGITLDKRQVRALYRNEEFS